MKPALAGGDLGDEGRFGSAGPAGVRDRRLGGEARGAGLESIETIVVIYAENRSFDNLYGYFPGANGLSSLTPAEYVQRDREARF